MKIAHISDNHSKLIPFPNEEFDVIVHSGDFLPNNRGRDRLDRTTEVRYQNNWLVHHEKQLVKWIGDKPFLFCAGNHDYTDPTVLMRKFGINAINITNAPYTFKGVNFYGFPYIPWTGAFWNYETFPNEMTEKVATLVQYINDGLVDVVVAHCPPYMYLDEAHGQRFGSTGIDNAFKYQVKKLPKHYLCGHIHESNGFIDYPSADAPEKMRISNAATTVHIITI